MEVDVPSNEEQKKQLSGLINREFKVGDTWYLISRDWWSHLKRYIGLDSDSFRNDSHQSPGRVDNSKLLQQTQDGFRLRAGLMEDIDFNAVPQEAWTLLKSWYQVVDHHHEIARKVINCSPVTSFIVDLRLEIYPIEFNLVVLLSSAPHSPALKTLETYSRTTPVQSLVEEMRAKVKAGKDCDFRVWVQNEQIWEHIKEETLTDPLDVIGIKTGSLVKIEFKPKSSSETWPMDLEENKKPQSQANSSASSSYRSTASSTSTSITTSSLSSTTTVGAGAAHRYETRSSGYSPSVGHNSSESSPHSPVSAALDAAGLNGFSNLGNTCFMNSALQCLSNVAPLTLYLLGPKWMEELNPENPLGTKGQIAEAYAYLVRANWTGHNAYSNIQYVREFKRAVGRFASQFSGYQQQDSQELLVFLLDGLHEDFNRVRNKPYVAARDYNNQPDEELARDSWNDYKKRNDSEIVDLFHGLYKSKLVCPDCMKESIKFDPFCYLSLPLPMKQERNYDLYFVPWDIHSPLQRFRVFISTGATIGELLAASAQILQIDSSEKLVLVDVYSNRFYKIFKSTDPVNSITEYYSNTSSVSYYVYELPVPFDDPNWFKAPLYVRKGVPDSTAWYSGGPNLVAFPQYVCIPRSELCYLTLYAAILERMRRFLDAPAFDQQRCQWVSKNLNPLVSLQLLDKFDQQEMTNLEPELKEDDKMDTSSAATKDKSRWTECKTLAADFLSGLNANEMKKAVQRPLFQISDVNIFGTTTYRVLTPPIVKLCKPSEGARGGRSLYSTAETDHKISNLGKQHDQIDNSDPTSTFLSADVFTDVFDAHFDGHAYATQENSGQSAIVMHPSLANKGAKKTIHITDCLDLYSSEERLGDNDLWYCPHCKKHVAASKKLSLWTLPPVLILHLKRFQYTRYYRDKLDSMVDFPLTGLDLSRFVASPEAAKQKQLYDLVAVSIHSGGLGGGHYTAYGRNELTERWYYFDDSSVSQVRNPEDVVCKGAYLLIYVRRSDEKIFNDIQNRMKTAITELVTSRSSNNAEASASSSQGGSSHSYNLRGHSQRGQSPALGYSSGNASGATSSQSSSAASASSSKATKPASPQQTLSSNSSTAGLSSPTQKPSSPVPIPSTNAVRSPPNGQDAEIVNNPMNTNDEVD